MDAVTTADVREWSNVAWEDRDYPAPADPADPDRLDTQVKRAISYVERITGRIAAELTVDTPIATDYQQAVQMRTEQTTVKSSDDYVGDINEDVINFRAGSYSQDRISKKERQYDGLNPWPDLNDLLIGLLTDEMREHWEEEGLIGVVSPAEAITYTVWLEED